MAPPDLTQSYIVKGSDFLHLANRPLPVAPDGYYDYEVRAANEANGKNDQFSRLHNIIDTVQQTVGKGLLSSEPSLEALANSVIHKDGVDDRLNLFTHALATMSELPDGPARDKLNDAAITTLYQTIPHPPATLAGPQFRAADGSNCSLANPGIGAAGTPYAKNVQNKHPQPQNTLPDPGLVFDMLLRAPRDNFVKHPGKNSALTFAFASLVTHSLFRTDPINMTQNNTSSYLDLSPLYGCTQDAQDLVRDRAAGRGLLYKDTFSEERLNFLPPAASALLVVFNRNHNYVADMLLKINERGRWTSPPPTDAKKAALQDEEIFQTARLINCGHFMALIFGDYVAGFLGLGRAGISWALDPFDPIRTETDDELPRGAGNHVSVEFNLLYRWHAVTSQKDIAWTEDEFGRLFGGKPLNEVGITDFALAASAVFKTMEPDPRKRTFGGLVRQADGSFTDDGLARILQDATDDCAGAYRARGTPECLRIIEILGITQARQWGVCTMNEFRRFLRLKPFASFEEWNPDAEIAHAARLLYGHIDNLELYAGLQAEQTIPLGRGSGICCGYTMTRAILGDAIALVRGDRFYTMDYTPTNLTSWGFQDCARDPDNGAYGAALPRLLFRHLPRHYPANSVYALFPFFIPEATKENLVRLQVADLYSFERPKPTPVPQVLTTLQGIRHVFADYKKFKTTYGADMRMLTNNYGFFLVFDEKTKHDVDRALVIHALFPSPQAVAEYTTWYRAKTIALLREKSVPYGAVPGLYVDIVKDVVNLVSVHWAADILCGIPLKTKATPHGLFTEQEVSDMFSLLFSCVFEDIQPEHGFALHAGAQKVGAIVNGLIEKSFNEVAPSTASTLVAIYTRVSQFIQRPVAKPCYPFLSRLAASGRPIKELVACVIGLAVGSSVNYSQAVAQIVDFYLDEKYVKERKEIERLSVKTDAASAELLRGYVREAMRLNPQFGGLFRAVAEDDVIPQGHGLPPLAVKQGDLLFASFQTAQLNPIDFPDPHRVDPTRPKASYQLQGAGFHNCPGVDFVAQTVPEIIKVIFTLPGLRRAPGARGVLASYIDRQFDTDNKFYITSTGTISPWPGSLQVVFDALPA